MTKMIPQTATWNRDDRDLLVELRTEMRSAREDINSVRVEIKDNNTGTTARLLNLEANAVSKIQLDTLQAEVDSLKLWRAYLAGITAICVAILMPVAFAVYSKFG